MGPVGRVREQAIATARALEDFVDSLHFDGGPDNEELRNRAHQLRWDLHGWEVSLRASDPQYVPIVVSVAPTTVEDQPAQQPEGPTA